MSGIEVDRKGNIVIRPSEGDKRKFRAGFDQIDWSKRETETIKPIGHGGSTEVGSGEAVNEHDCLSG